MPCYRKPDHDPTSWEAAMSPSVPRMCFSPVFCAKPCLGNRIKSRPRTRQKPTMPYETTAWAGPLTTIWSDGLNCLQTYTSAAGVGFAATYSLFFGHWGDYKPASTCYPPAKTRVDVGAPYYFSPGVCPLGWATACSYTGHDNIPSTVTASLCCPR